MDDNSFLALAPREGGRPLLGYTCDIGTSGMHGGAFSWGSLWSGLKNVGSQIKSWGNRAWNSSTGQLVRDKLKDSKVQEKVADGIVQGIHGALDLAQQEMQKAIEKRLDSQRVPPSMSGNVQVEEPSAPEIVTPAALPKPAPPEPVEEVVITADEPPAYDDDYDTKSAPPAVERPLPRPLPMTRPVPSMATPVRPPPASSSAPPRTPTAPARRPAKRARPRGWQNTLQNIVGMGVHFQKRRRCY
ncbi:pVI [Mastadenovirus porcusquartum]|uniref:Pre-protein VI n=1 Tax=Mastadenovirus porcusquartum TaxID=3241439 RepID=A0A5P9VJN8_9ADEN|nr:pVI [Porcine mastadenovirus B]QFX65715.1 pVI [Porcine mastadenovirus B]